MSSDSIKWPTKYHPDTSAVHVVNSLVMNVTCEQAWDKLIRPLDWPTWYPNASNVELINTTTEALARGNRFRWKTFGVTIECTVEEFQPFERIAWLSESFGMSVYHAWLLTPHAKGCQVVTEETQNGFIPHAAKLLMPRRMHKFHQIWLEQLNEVARTKTTT